MNDDPLVIQLSLGVRVGMSLALVGSCVVLALIAVATVDGFSVEGVVMLFFCVLLLGGSRRAMRIGVVADDDGLVVRLPVGTQRYRWSEVGHFIPFWAIPAWQIGFTVERGGRTPRTGGIGCFFLRRQSALRAIEQLEGRRPAELRASGPFG